MQPQPVVRRGARTAGEKKGNLLLSSGKSRCGQQSQGALFYKKCCRRSREFSSGTTPLGATLAFLLIILSWFLSLIPSSASSRSLSTCCADFGEVVDNHHVGQSRRSGRDGRGREGHAR